MSNKMLSIEMYMRNLRRYMTIEELVVRVELKMPMQGDDAFYLNLSVCSQDIIIIIIIAMLIRNSISI